MKPDLDGKRVLVLGLGVSGRSAAAFCAARGAQVVAADERDAGALAPLDAPAPGVTLRLGRPFPDPSDFDLVVPSPGVPAERYADRASRVWGDVELAWRALAVPLVAITGTNGKSTTTRMVERMLKVSGFRARAAGNLGEPALSLVGQPLDVAVLEVSSFQLETTEAFRPAVAVVLNVTPDHLDRHGSFDAYAAAKARILENQRVDDVAVLNFDDPVVREMADAAPGRVLPFRSTGPLERGVWLDAGAIAIREEGEAPRRLPLDGIQSGGPDRDNALAALAAACAIGADPVRALAALARFEGLPHRAQVVAKRGGVTWVDDSKATNPGAAARSLAGSGHSVIWIAGGRDKGLDLSALAAQAAPRVKAAVLIGESAPTLARALSGRTAVHRADAIEDAVARAAQLARCGDVVLLAPGCSSHDQFRSFEERGLRFRAAVESLPHAERSG